MTDEGQATKRYTLAVAQCFNDPRLHLPRVMTREEWNKHYAEISAKLSTPPPHYVSKWFYPPGTAYIPCFGYRIHTLQTVLEMRRAYRQAKTVKIDFPPRKPMFMSVRPLEKLIDDAQLTWTIHRLEKLMSSLQRTPVKYVTTFIYGPLGKQEGHRATDTLMTDTNREQPGGAYDVCQTLREKFMKELEEKIEKYKKENRKSF